MYLEHLRADDLYIKQRGNGEPTLKVLLSGGKWYTYRQFVIVISGWYILIDQFGTLRFNYVMHTMQSEKIRVHRELNLAGIQQSGHPCIKLLVGAQLTCILDHSACQISYTLLHIFLLENRLSLSGKWAYC